MPYTRHTEFDRHTDTGDICPHAHTSIHRYDVAIISFIIIHHHLNMYIFLKFMEKPRNSARYSKARMVYVMHILRFLPCQAYERTAAPYTGWQLVMTVGF